MSTIGIDLGGTHLRGLLLDQAGRAGEPRKLRLGDDRSPAQVLDRIAELATALSSEAAAEDPPAALGLGIAGWVRPSDGWLIKAPNLGWSDLPLQSMLEERLGLPVLAMNDLSAIAYGEWQQGAARGVDDALVVFAGSGVGSALVQGGQLQEGAGGYAGEIGHMPLVLSGGAACGCGRKGCLETVCGGVFIERRVRAAAAGGAYGRVLQLAGRDLGAITCAQVEQAAAEGDPEAVALWDEVALALGSGLAAAGNLLDPAVLVLGGGVMQGCPLLRERAVNVLRAALLPPIADALELRRPELGERAGVIGAALRARATLPLATP